MNVCDKCGYKVISNAMFAKHNATHVIDPVEPPVSTGSPTLVETAKPVEVIPEVRVEAPTEDGVTMHFSKSIEVYINGIAYVGKDIKVKDMSIASEIVRIAREAYGPEILV
jgi:hypothetical protein